MIWRDKRHFNEDKSRRQPEFVASARMLIAGNNFPLETWRLGSSAVFMKHANLIRLTPSFYAQSSCVSSSWRSETRNLELYSYSRYFLHCYRLKKAFPPPRIISKMKRSNGVNAITSILSSRWLINSWSRDPWSRDWLCPFPLMARAVSLNSFCVPLTFPRCYYLY